MGIVFKPYVTIHITHNGSGSVPLSFKWGVWGGDTRVIEVRRGRVVCVCTRVCLCVCPSVL